MEQQYWIGRKRAAMAMAEGASTSKARLIHYDLAGRYSVRAAQAPPPFMLPTAPRSDAVPLGLPAPAPSAPRPPEAPRGPWLREDPS